MGNIYEIEAAQQLHPPFAQLGHRLTSRQLDVLTLMCEGLPNKVIGRKLNIANGTVKIHVANILRALNVSSRVQAVIVARDLIAHPAFNRGEGAAAPATKAAHPGGLRLVKGDDASARACVFDRVLAAAG